MKSKVQIEIVLDDGGGIDLVVWRDKYAHIYDYEDQLAEDLVLLMEGDNATSWDNNQWGGGIIRDNQCCRYYCGTPNQIIVAVIKDFKSNNIYGANHQGLARALIERL